jgi:hypothetical protein
MGYDVYLSWDGMTAKEVRAQEVLWDLEGGYVGYLRAALWMHREIRFLSEVFRDVPWWEGPPRQGRARPYDFKANFPKMKEAAKKYLKDARAEHDADYLLALPMRTPEANRDTPTEVSPHEGLKDYPTDHLIGDDAESWIRSVFDFFKLGLRKQEEGKTPKVEVT